MSTSKVGRTIHPRDVVTPGHSAAKTGAQTAEATNAEITRLKKANELLSTELNTLKTKVEKNEELYTKLVKTTLDMTEMVKKLIKKDSTLTENVERLSTTVTTFINCSDTKTIVMPETDNTFTPSIQNTQPQTVVEVKAELPKKKWKFF